MKLEEVIGQRIRIGREAHQWSQQQLGEKLEPYLGRIWTRQAVSTAEKGGRDFAAAELVAFASVFHVDLAWLFVTDAAAVELPGRTISSTDLHERFAERPEAENQRRVGESLAQLHAQAREGLAAAETALRTADEYAKWLSADLSDTEGEA